MNAELKPCKCGNSATTDWGGCSEIAGRCWQTFTIRCANPEQYGCFREVQVTIDGDDDSGWKVQAAAIAVWNSTIAQTEEDTS